MRGVGRRHVRTVSSCPAPLVPLLPWCSAPVVLFRSMATALGDGWTGWAWELLPHVSPSELKGRRKPTVGPTSQFLHPCSLMSSCALHHWLSPSQFHDFQLEYSLSSAFWTFCMRPRRPPSHSPSFLKIMPCFENDVNLAVPPPPQPFALFSCRSPSQEWVDQHGDGKAYRRS